MSRVFQGSKKQGREGRLEKREEKKLLNSQLIMGIGGYIMEHGEFIFDKELARMSSGMKLKVRETPSQIHMQLVEPDGEIYTVPETYDGTRLSTEGKGPRVRVGEADAGEAVRDEVVERPSAVSGSVDPSTAEKDGGERG